MLPEISDNDDDDREERADEKPVVVVVKSGDLTAEEANAFKKQKDEGNEQSNFFKLLRSMCDITRCRE